jgi:hypothetical protein
LNWYREKFRKVYCQSGPLSPSRLAACLYHQLVKWADAAGWIEMPPGCTDPAVGLKRRFGASRSDRQRLPLLLQRLAKANLIEIAVGGRIRVVQIEAHLPRQSRKGPYAHESWRRFYCEERGSYSKLSILARGLVGEILRRCDDEGRAYYDEKPVEMTAFWDEDRSERETLRDLFEELAGDGTIEHCEDVLPTGQTRRYLRLKNFVAAQHLEETTAISGQASDTYLPPTGDLPAGYLPPTGDLDDTYRGPSSDPSVTLPVPSNTQVPRIVQNSPLRSDLIRSDPNISGELKLSLVGSEKPDPTHAIPVPQLTSEPDRRQAPRRSGDYPPWFEAIWDVYPGRHGNKGGKKAAFDAAQKQAGKTKGGAKALSELVLKALSWQSLLFEWTKVDPNTPDLERYLRKQRYLDERPQNPEAFRPPSVEAVPAWERAKLAASLEARRRAQERERAEEAAVQARPPEPTWAEKVRDYALAATDWQNPKLQEEPFTLADVQNPETREIWIAVLESRLDEMREARDEYGKRRFSKTEMLPRFAREYLAQKKAASQETALKPPGAVAAPVEPNRHQKLGGLVAQLAEAKSVPAEEEADELVRPRRRLVEAAERFDVDPLAAKGT